MPMSFFKTCGYGRVYFFPKKLNQILSRTYLNRFFFNFAEVLETDRNVLISLRRCFYYIKKKKKKVLKFFINVLRINIWFCFVAKPNKAYQ